MRIWNQECPHLHHPVDSWNSFHRLWDKVLLDLILDFCRHGSLTATPLYLLVIHRAPGPAGNLLWFYLQRHSCLRTWQHSEQQHLRFSAPNPSHKATLWDCVGQSGLEIQSGFISRPRSLHQEEQDWCKKRRVFLFVCLVQQRSTLCNYKGHSTKKWNFIIYEASPGSIFLNMLFNSSINTSGPGNALANTH